MVGQRSRTTTANPASPWPGATSASKAPPPAPEPPPPGVAIVDAATLPFERLTAFDQRFFPAPHDTFLSLWIALPGHRARVALRGGEIAELAVARPCR